jgi:hypothetical protein
VRPSRLLVLVLALVGSVLAGCSAGPSFDPSGPCTVDGQVPGAYPDLEAQIPPVLEADPPTRLDSGRNCTGRNLGTLAAAGIREVRFAGGLWELGERSGVTLALMTAPGLTQQMVADFYEAGARSGRKTEDVRRSGMPGDRGSWTRIETLNDQSFQTIVIMQDQGVADRVQVVLVGSDVREIADRDAHDGRVIRAIEAWEATFPRS